MPHLALGDIDGDGVLEAVPSFVCDDKWRHGMVVDWDGSELRAVSHFSDDTPLRSFRWPFEIVRPMQHKPALIARYDEADLVSYVEYVAGSISAKAIDI